MKKILVSFILALFSSSMALASFSDVESGYRYYAAISYLEASSVVGGYNDGTFMPDQSVNRAEALKMILSGTKVDSDELETYELPFSDLASNAWYLPYINTAYDMGIVSGYSDSTFAPEQTVNLAEALKMIALASNADLTYELSEYPYEDVSSDAWFAPYAQYAKNLNLIEPEDDGLLYPSQTLSRAELSEIIYRFMYVDENNLGQFDISLNWQSYQNEQGYEVKYPYGWQVVTGSDGGIVLWNQDEGNNQAGFVRQYPNSASVSIFVNDNNDGMSAESFFEEISSLAEYDGDVSLNELTIDGLSALQVYYPGDAEPIMDMYVYLPNETVLTMHGSYGDGALSEYSHQQIYAMEVSARYVEDAVTTTTDWGNILEEARSLIMTEDMGNYALSLFDDRYLIETDTIGVGTGPVDYYYSAGADVTLKYERSFDMILDIQSGQTTGF